MLVDRPWSRSDGLLDLPSPAVPPTALRQLRVVRLPACSAAGIEVLLPQGERDKGPDGSLPGEGVRYSPVR